MKSKSIILIAFILVIITQLFVPIQMISGQEEVLSTGKILKFKTAPVDPYDAFRGKYIYLNFKDDKIKVTKELNELKSNDAIFLTFKDSSGFAVIASASGKEPKNTSLYIKAKVNYVDAISMGKFNHPVSNNGRNFVYIDYPFDRFYMNENKAPQAEKAYAESNRDSQKNVYAEIAIKNGIGVVKDVFINDIPIKDFVNQRWLFTKPNIVKPSIVATINTTSHLTEFQTGSFFTLL